MSVDRRARVDGSVEPVGPGAFFRHDLPAAAAAHAALLAPALRWYDPAPLTVAVDGGRWTLRAESDRLVVAEGGGGAEPELALTVLQLTELVADLATPLRWSGEGELVATAPLSLLLDWWVLLRGALDGIAPRVPGTAPGPVTGPDAGAGAGRRPEGEPEPYRRFGPDDDPAAMGAFLERSGYLHLAGVFGRDEMAAVSADIDRAVPDRGTRDRSWWAASPPRGEPVRVLGFEGLSAGARQVLADRRLAMLGGLTGDGHTLAATPRPGMEALLRPAGASDVAWHADCAFGRHSYDCASLTVGVAVTGGGHLRVRAGSHRSLGWPAFVRPGDDLPVVDVAARAGDVTVHLSCTSHMVRPSARAERRALYTAFGLPPRRVARPPGEAPARTTDVA